MILGTGIFGYRGSAFRTVPYITNFYRLEIQNAIFDEVKIDDTIDMIYNSSKEDWGYYTSFDFKAQGDLEAGNINNKGVPIEKILFQKRKSDEYEWVNIAEFDFDSLQKIYSWLDTYVANGTEYEYCLVPLTANVTGNRKIETFTPTFNGVFLTDKNTNIQMFYNLQQGEIENVNPSYVYETLGSEYPIVGYSNLNYCKSSIKAMVVDSEDINLKELTPHTQKQKRDMVMKLLINHKPKLFRSENGEFMMISIINNPKFTPNNDLNGIIGDVSFEFVEKGEVNKTNLENNGF